MKRPLILAAMDAEARALHARLVARGSEPVVCAHDSHFELELRGGWARWTVAGNVCFEGPLAEPGFHHWRIGSMYVRTLTAPPTHHQASDHWSSDDVVKELFYATETLSLKYAFILHLQRAGVPVLNGFPALSMLTNKVFNLLKMSEAGVPIPETLVTQDGNSVKAFHVAHPATIYKAVGASSTVRRVAPGDLTASRLAQLARAPVKFQERFGGDDVRVYATPKRVLGAILLSSDDADDVRASYRQCKQFDPPQRLAEAAMRATALSGLGWSAVDVKVRGDDFRVLECNAWPMFARMEELSGAPIADELAAYLLEGCA